MSPASPSVRIELFARTRPPRKLIVLASGRGLPPGNRVRWPKSVGLTTVTFAATERAVRGTPQRPAIGKVRLVFESREGAPQIPAASRVSVMRQGVSVKKLNGPLQPVST